MQMGAVPYRDIVDVNMPLTYYLDLAVVTIGGTGDIAWRVFDLTAAAVAAVLILMLLWPAGPAAGFLAVLVVLATHLLLGPYMAGPRGFVMLVVALAAAGAPPTAAVGGAAARPPPPPGRRGGHDRSGDQADRGHAAAAAGAGDAVAMARRSVDCGRRRNRCRPGGRNAGDCRQPRRFRHDDSDAVAAVRLARRAFRSR